MSFSRAHVIAGSVIALASLIGCSSPDASQKDSSGSVDSSESDLKLTSPKYLGVIADGETKTISYSDPPKYRAYGFTAVGGDEVTVSVKSVNGDAMGWITTSGYSVLAANDDASSSTLDAKVVYTVPAGAASKSYRIVFRDYDLLDATFDVKLTIKSATPPPPACDPDAEPWRTYVGTPDQCQVIRYTCTTGTRSFSNDCGCGCESTSH